MLSDRTTSDTLAVIQRGDWDEVCTDKVQGFLTSLNQSCILRKLFKHVVMNHSLKTSLYVPEAA